MRIRGVNIRSFGALRERRYDLSEGMTVFHGPNESGKTTTMEFIRSVLVPSNKRNQYPERDKSDSGTLSYEQDGQTRTVRLTYRSVEGERPVMPTGTDDPQLYRSVFAMTSRDLDDERVLTEGGIRSRFLTVPGGESMPAARDSAAEKWETNLGKRSNSRSRAIALESEIDNLDGDIAQARSVTDQYGALDARRKELGSRLGELSAESERSVEAKRVHDVYQSNRGNYERLSALEDERRNLAVKYGEPYGRLYLLLVDGEERGAADERRGGSVTVERDARGDDRGGDEDLHGVALRELDHLLGDGVEQARIEHDGEVQNGEQQQDAGVSRGAQAVHDPVADKRPLVDVAGDDEDQEREYHRYRAQGHQRRQLLGHDAEHEDCDHEPTEDGYSHNFTLPFPFSLFQPNQ